jgi:hypothetical protein
VGDEIARVLRSVFAKKAKTPARWKALRDELALLDDEAREREAADNPSAWQRTAGLLLCDARLEAREERVVLLSRLRGGLPEAALLDERLAATIEATLVGGELAWLEVLQPLLADVAGSGDREQIEGVMRWVARMPSQVLIEMWTELLLDRCDSDLVLARAAAALNEAETALYATRLLRRAIEIGGETPTLVGMLHGALVAGGDFEGAAALDEKLASFPRGDDVQGRIDEYLRVYNAITARQHEAGMIPMSELPATERLLELEEALNAYWLLLPARTREQAIAERRFVAGGSLIWISMHRDARDYAAAVDRLRAVTARWDLLLLIHAANGPTLEALLNNGLGACLDSQREDDLVFAASLLDRLEAELPKPGLADLHWNAACVRARSGDTERALAQVAAAIERGVDPAQLAQDSDLAELRDDRRFAELVGLD